MGNVVSKLMENVESIVELESYNLETGQWTKEIRVLRFESRHFSNGGTRYAHMAWTPKTYVDPFSTLSSDYEPMVLKMPINAHHQTQYQKELEARNRVIMHTKCVGYAKLFNQEPVTPKMITYVPCQLVKFLNGPWANSYGCLETFLLGDFVKHNTAHPDYVGLALSNRNTPQAFSHYTLVKSGYTEMVVDVEGVWDTYTDPQLYSTSLYEGNPLYGPADWNMCGVANFFRQHQCNTICQALGLPINRMAVCNLNPISMQYWTGTVVGTPVFA